MRQTITQTCSMVGGGGSKCLIYILWVRSYPLEYIQGTYLKAINKIFTKNSLKIPTGYSESVNRRRTDNTMAKRKRTKGQTAIYKT